MDVVLHPGTMRQHYDRLMSSAVPFREFPQSYVQTAKNTPIDWREKGAVTPAKDQGPLGFCGTFGRTAAAEGQFAIHNHELRNFSEEELIDCIGWDQDQFSYFAEYGFMDMSAYPYIPNGTTTDEPPNEKSKFVAFRAVQHCNTFDRRCSGGNRRCIGGR